MSRRVFSIGLMVLLFVVISCTVASANNCPNCGAFIPLPWDLTQQFVICANCGWSGFYSQTIVPPPPTNPPPPWVPPVWYFVYPPTCTLCGATIAPYGAAYYYPSGDPVNWSSYVPGSTGYIIMCSNCFLFSWPDFP